MKPIVLIVLLFAGRLSFGFETAFADSLALEAQKLPADRAIGFMLDHFYAVFTSNADDARAWTTICLRYSEQSGKQQLIGRSHLNLGVVSYLSGDYENCLDHYQQALDIFEKIDDKAYTGRTCNELAVYSRKQKQFRKGLEYLDRSYKNCMLARDSACVETSLNNRAVIYEMMGEYDLALTYYRKAEAIAKSTGNLVGLGYIYADAAECYRRKNDLDSCAILIDQSIRILEQTGDRQGVGMNLLNKGILLASQHKRKEAVAVFKRCIDLAEKMSYTDLLKNAHYELGKVYADLGDFEQSVYHIDRSHTLRDSLLNSEKVQALSDMEVKYETEKVRADYLREQQERAAADLKVESRNKWLLGISGLFLALVFFGLFMYQRRLRIAQSEKDRAVIAEREKGLQAVFDATEEERQRIAKDLHDGIGQQMSGLKMAWQNLAVTIGSRESDRLKELTAILDSTASEVRELSHRMMPKVLDEFGLVNAIEGMLENSLKHTPLHYTFEHYNFDQRLPRKTELSLFRITQELLNNIIKHSDASEVSVQLFKNQGQLILIVEDNGKGFDPGMQKDGHGLLNIHSRLNTINGQVNYEASPGAGTTATIRVMI